MPTILNYFNTVSPLHSGIANRSVPCLTLFTNCMMSCTQAGLQKYISQERIPQLYGFISEDDLVGCNIILLSFNKTLQRCVPQCHCSWNDLNEVSLENKECIAHSYVVKMNFPSSSHIASQLHQNILWLNISMEQLATQLAMS